MRTIGSPVARLANVEDGFERYSGQPRMSNIPVAVRRADATLASDPSGGPADEAGGGATWVTQPGELPS